MRLTDLFCRTRAACVHVSQRPMGARPKGEALPCGLRATRIRLIAGVCICSIFASGEWLHGQTVRVGPAAAAGRDRDTEYANVAVLEIGPLPMDDIEHSRNRDSRRACPASDRRGWTVARFF